MTTEGKSESEKNLFWINPVKWRKVSAGISKVSKIFFVKNPMKNPVKKPVKNPVKRMKSRNWKNFFSNNKPQPQSMMISGSSLGIEVSNILIMKITAPLANLRKLGFILCIIVSAFFCHSIPNQNRAPSGSSNPITNPQPQQPQQNSRFSIQKQQYCPVVNPAVNPPWQNTYTKTKKANTPALLPLYYFILAMEWPPSLVMKNRQKNDKDVSDIFQLHGLWPENSPHRKKKIGFDRNLNNDRELYSRASRNWKSSFDAYAAAEDNRAHRARRARRGCAATRTPRGHLTRAEVSAAQVELNMKLWKHEWDYHGVYSNLDQGAYMHLALDLFDKYESKVMLAIYKSSSWASVRSGMTEVLDRVKFEAFLGIEISTTRLVCFQENTKHGVKDVLLRVDVFLEPVDPYDPMTFNRKHPSSCKRSRIYLP